MRPAFRNLLRFLPAFGVIALIVLALTAPLRRAGASGGNSIAYVSPNCTSLGEVASGSSVVTIDPHGNLTQPLGSVTVVASCSLGVVRPNDPGISEILFLHADPATLLPDPTTVALRARAFQGSEIIFYGARVNFYPPLVTRADVHVADCATTPIAMNYFVSDAYWSRQVNFQADGPLGEPVAYARQSGGSAQVLPGSHPVVSYWNCNGGTPFDGHRIVQAVMTTNVLESNQHYQWAQRFRVPQAMQIGWFELAFGTDQFTYPLGFGSVEVYDATGQDSPPDILPAPIVHADFIHTDPIEPVWDSHNDFDRQIALAPLHDYWLVVRVNFDYRLYTRVATGSEGPDFTSAIGPLFRRGMDGASWDPVAGKALCFRLIGMPIPTVDVERVTPARTSFALRVAPNPSHGAIGVSWSGASGAVRLDVLDARGRRVATDASAGARWSWEARDAEGRPLPGGVYYVRAVDASRRVATARVVLVR